VFLNLKIDVGVAKVELETAPEVRVSRATIYLAQGVVAERVDGAETG
jgi:hypothetical protein